MNLLDEIKSAELSEIQCRKVLSDFRKTKVGAEMIAHWENTVAEAASKTNELVIQQFRNKPRGPTMRDLIDDGHLAPLDPKAGENKQLSAYRAGDYDQGVLDKASYNGEKFLIEKGGRGSDKTPEDLGRPERLTYNAQLVFVDANADYSKLEARVFAFGAIGDVQRFTRHGTHMIFDDEGEYCLWADHVKAYVDAVET